MTQAKASIRFAHIACGDIDVANHEPLKIPTRAKARSVVELAGIDDIHSGSLFTNRLQSEEFGTSLQ